MKKQKAASPAPAQKPCYLLRLIRPGESGLVREGNAAGDPLKRVTSDDFTVFFKLPFNGEALEYQVIACASEAEADKLAKELAPGLPTAHDESAKNKAKAQAKIKAIMAKSAAETKAKEPAEEQAKASPALAATSELGNK